MAVTHLSISFSSSCVAPAWVPRQPIPSPWGSLTLVRFYVSDPSSQSSMTPDAEISKDIDLKDVISSDDSFLLNVVGFPLHPPHHGAFNQTRTREIHQGPGHLHLPCVKPWWMLSSSLTKSSFFAWVNLVAMLLLWICRWLTSVSHVTLMSPLGSAVYW